MRGKKAKEITFNLYRRRTSSTRNPLPGAPGHAPLVWEPPRSGDHGGREPLETELSPHSGSTCRPVCWDLREGFLVLSRSLFEKGL